MNYYDIVVVNCLAEHIQYYLERGNKIQNLSNISSQVSNCYTSEDPQSKKKKISRSIDDPDIEISTQGL